MVSSERQQGVCEREPNGCPVESKGKWSPSGKNLNLEVRVRAMATEDIDQAKSAADEPARRTGFD